MKTNSDIYFLKVGKEGKDRLEILNEIFADYSTAFLLKMGLSKGNNVLEIGCGSGNMTCWLAEQVGIHGKIYAQDISAEQIAIAKRRAEEKNLKNIIFIQESMLDLFNSSQAPLVDIIYTRFVLVYLADVFQALKDILRTLKPGGHIICEEACNTVSYCYPFSAAIAKSRQLLLELANRKGIEFDLGDKLYSYFYKLNLTNIQAQFSQPLYQTKRQRQFPLLTFQEACDHYISHSLIDINEAKQLTLEITQCIDDENYLMSFPRTTQICGQKLNGPIGK